MRPRYPTHHRQGRALRHRHPGRTLHPLPDARAPARRPHRHRHPQRARHDRPDPPIPPLAVPELIPVTDGGFAPEGTKPRECFPDIACARTEITEHVLVGTPESRQQVPSDRCPRDSHPGQPDCGQDCQRHCRREGEADPDRGRVAVSPSTASLKPKALVSLPRRPGPSGRCGCSPRVRYLPSPCPVEFTRAMSATR